MTFAADVKEISHFHANLHMGPFVDTRGRVDARTIARPRARAR